MEDKITILKKLNNILSITNYESTWQSISGSSKYTLEETKSFIRKLRKDDYITVYRLDTKEVMPNDEEFGWDNRHRIHRSAEGDLFILQGGYEAEEKSNQRTKNKQLAWKLVDVFLAITTLVLGFFSYQQANKISSIEKNNEVLKTQIENLTPKK